MRKKFKILYGFMLYTDQTSENKSYINVTLLQQQCERKILWGDI